jgi:tetratricopeptide (TPR) repeat protein
MIPPMNERQDDFLKAGSHWCPFCGKQGLFLLFGLLLSSGCGQSKEQEVDAFNRGMAYGNKGEFDKAIADFTEAIQLDPKLAQAYNNRGVAYYFSGQYDKAWAEVEASSIAHQPVPCLA